MADGEAAESSADLEVLLNFIPLPPPSPTMLGVPGDDNGESSSGELERLALTAPNISSPSNWIVEEEFFELYASSSSLPELNPDTSLDLHIPGEVQIPDTLPDIPQSRRDVPPVWPRLMQLNRSPQLEDGNVQSTMDQSTLDRFHNLIDATQRHQLLGSGTMPPPASQQSTSEEQLINDISTASKKRRLGTIPGGSKDSSGCCDCGSDFECRICYEPAKLPVVTPCGHLFCWRCLHKWLHCHSLQSECPVCKAEVLDINITPIYGSGKENPPGIIDPDVPPRPRPPQRLSSHAPVPNREIRSLSLSQMLAGLRQPVLAAAAVPAPGVARGPPREVIAGDRDVAEAAILGTPPSTGRTLRSRRSSRVVLPVHVYLPSFALDSSVNANAAAAESEPSSSTDRSLRPPPGAAL